jgi:hypothetical protein
MDAHGGESPTRKPTQGGDCGSATVLRNNNKS